jgi:cell division inhibitor SepF
VVVIEPRAFEEVLEIIDHLRDRKSVILNLHLLDTHQSQRVVDFLSGATHAIDGHQQRIGDGVFIFTPNNVMISSEVQKTGLALNDAFWNTAR